MKTLLFAFIFCLLWSQADAQPAKGDDPTQALTGYGVVKFLNSGAPAAQADFLAGLALLHDFEYPRAAVAFQRAQAADPGFAMAYWGEAMTFNHPIWAQQDISAGRAALQKLGRTADERRAKARTEREKAYLRSVEILYGNGNKFERDFLYEKALADLHRDYPNDVDATAFYGLAILGTAHAGRDVATYMRAASVLEEAWIDHRDHPGLVHYLIHCYDDPDHAPLGLRAARIYARIAPNAGHAQHMTSHIFVALGMWSEVVQANVAAITVVNNARKNAGKSAANCGHYPTWLNYGDLQLGNLDDAKAAVANCRATVELQSGDNAASSQDPDDNVTASYSNMRLRFLVDAGTWPAEMSDWTLPSSVGTRAKLDFEFARFLNELNLQHQAQASEIFKELEAIGKEVVDIETKKANPDPSYRVRPEILVLEAKAMLLESDKNFVEAEQMLKRAVSLEEGLPMAFGPPVIEKPTHELLGEFLLRRGRKEDAAAEFRKALARTPGRRLAMKGLASATAN
jgi:tetratricopeptide (TPR) repeat protein